jgi:Flp pilus assembly protein TadD
MKLVPPVAYALMLSLGATAMVAVPAAAAKQKKEDKDAAPKFMPSPDFQKPAVAVDTAIKAKDFATAETQLAAAEPLAKTDDDRYFVGIFHLQIATGKNDNAGVAKALDLLLVNPKTPPETLGMYNNVRGGLALDAKQNAEAIPYLLKARQLGIASSDLSVSLARAYAATGKTNEAIAELDKAIAAEAAAGRKAPEAWYGFAATNSFAARDLPAAEKWLARQLKEYPKSATWQTGVLNYRKITDPNGTLFTKGQKLELYRMMRTTQALTDQGDYYRYAQAAVDAGFPWEAVSAIDAGRASGKITAGNPDVARVYKTAKDSIAMESTPAVYETRAKAATVGAKVLEGADVNLAAGNYAQAVELYGAALAKGGVNASDVNLRLGYALANLGRKDEAKAAFAKVSGAPLGDIAQFWTIWLDVPQLAA